MCVLTNHEIKDIKCIEWDFHFVYLGHALGVRFRGQQFIISSNHLYVMLSPPKPWDEIWYVSYSHEWAIQCNCKFCLAQCPLVKRSNIITLQLQSFSKLFIPNSVCVLTNKRYKTYIEQDFHSVARVMPQRSQTLGAWGQKFNFSEHGHMACQIEGDDE